MTQLYAKNPVTGEFEPVKDDVPTGLVSPDDTAQGNTPYPIPGDYARGNTPPPLPGVKPTLYPTTPPKPEGEWKYADGKWNFVTNDPSANYVTSNTSAKMVSPDDAGPKLVPVHPDVTKAITPPPLPGQDAVKPAGVWVEGVNENGMPILTYTPNTPELERLTAEG